MLASFAACERIAALLEHLAAERATAVRDETERLVIRLISRHGVQIEAPDGHFAAGQPSYAADLVPVIVKAFEAKGYLPYRDSSYWRARWQHARFVAAIEVSEKREGNYLASANRLTRIEVRLTVTSLDRRALLFQTTPTARSRVPLPKLPLYLSNRVALSSERSEELERLLYDDARGQIDGSLAHSLGNIPECPASPAIKTSR